MTLESHGSLKLEKTQVQTIQLESTSQAWVPRVLACCFTSRENLRDHHGDRQDERQGVPAPRQGRTNISQSGEGDWRKLIDSDG